MIIQNQNTFEFSSKFCFEMFGVWHMLWNNLSVCVIIPKAWILGDFYFIFHTFQKVSKFSTESIYFIIR